MLWGTTRNSGVRRLRAAAAVAIAAAFVSACSAGDVELNGKLFELAGLSSMGKKSGDAKLAPRTGLVVPPDLQKLPDPNQPQAEAPANDLLAQIDDPDRKQVKDQAQLEREQAEACKKYELAKMRGDPDADMISGPLGDCRQSVLTAVGNWMKPE